MQTNRNTRDRAPAWRGFGQNTARLLAMIGAGAGLLILMHAAWMTMLAQRQTW